MNEVIFNVVVNEPNQIVHCDFKNPKKAFMIFGHFKGQKIGANEYKIDEVIFHVEEVDLTLTTASRHVFHEVDSNSFAYKDDHINASTGEEMKQIAFEFKKDGKLTPITTRYQKSFNVKLGEKLDIHALGKGFPFTFGAIEIDTKGRKNINSHICSIRFFFS